MKVILQSVTVIDPTSAHHLKVVDIFVQDNLIKEIGKKLGRRNPLPLAKQILLAILSGQRLGSGLR